MILGTEELQHVTAGAYHKSTQTHTAPLRITPITKPGLKLCIQSVTEWQNRSSNSQAPYHLILESLLSGPAALEVPSKCSTFAAGPPFSDAS